MTIRKKILIISVFTLLLILFLAYCLFQISKSRSFQFFGELIDRVETEEKVVALTFDDGPTIHTQEVLQILKEKEITATFFTIGQDMAKHPEIAKQIVDEGHQIANHSFTHPRFLLKSQATIDHEIQSTNQLIRETGYQGEIMFRPPTGKKLFGLPWYLQQHNIKTIMWDVEPDTYIDQANDLGISKTDFLVKYTLENTQPGSIILLHPFCEACQHDREAIPLIIDRLKEKGYRFVRVEELLSYGK